MNLVALHGFWGAPSDFDRFISYLQPDRVWVPNLFEPGPLDPSHSFAEWTENVLKEVKKRFAGPVYLAGYSQGARLALHALIAETDLFKRTLLMSCHPGQLGPQEKAQRLHWLQTWRVKFLEDDWEQLVFDWNAQDVFRGDAAESKPKINREILAQALENWSVLRHGFGWEELQRLPGSVCWAFGAQDPKFQAVKDRLERHDGTFKISIIENAGHRILSDQPEMAAQLLRKDLSYAK